MLVKELSRNEREEVKLAFLPFLCLLLSLKLIVEHFLVIEEQEFVLKDL